MILKQEAQGLLNQGKAHEQHHPGEQQVPQTRVRIGAQTTAQDLTQGHGARLRLVRRWGQPQGCCDSHQCGQGRHAVKRENQPHRRQQTTGYRPYHRPQIVRCTDTAHTLGALLWSSDISGIGCGGCRRGRHNRRLHHATEYQACHQ